MGLLIVKCCMIMINQLTASTFWSINHLKPMTGLADVCGKKITEVIPGIRETNPELLEIYGRVASTGLSETFEIFVEQMDLWFSISVTSPSQGYFVAVFDVINDRKLAEQNLKTSESQFREMFSGHSAIMLLVEPETGQIIDANDSAIQFYGYPKSVLCSMNIREINTLDNEEIKVKRLNAMGQKENYFVFPHRLADGTIRTVEVHSSPIAYQNKAILFSIIHDITDRIAAEKIISENERFLKACQDIVRLGPFSLDLLQETWTSSELLDDILGIASDFDKTLQGWVSLLHPEWREELRVYYHHQVKNLDPSFNIEYQIVRPNDQVVRWIHSVGQIEFDAQNQPVVLIGTLADITERKESERQVRESEEKWRTLFEILPVGVSILDRDGKISEF